MMSLLAQVTDPSAQSIKDWLAVVLYIAGIATAILGVIVLIKQLREKPPEPLPQPMRVQQQHEFVTTTTHAKDITEIKDELKRHAGRRAEIYDTQKEQGAQIAGLVEKTDMMNATQIRQEGKIDIILQRLPSKP